MAAPESELCGQPREVALPALVDRYGGRLFHLGLRFCGNRAEAEDLVQETFLNAWKSWDTFAGRSSVRAWLFTIAAHACQRMHRKRAGEPEALASLEDDLPFGEPLGAVVPGRGTTPLEETLRAEGTARVEAAIAALPEDFRLPLVLKEVVGFSLAEIAGILGLKPETVKTRLHRARLKVREALEGVLPREPLPRPVYDREVCLDLLRAKQETLDRGLPYEFPDGVVCERCRAFFDTLDLATDLCTELGTGALPRELRDALEQRFAAAG